jgi:uncharacterized repeat protein (TIGR03803 family)
VLHLFTWAKEPSGNLIFDAAGNIYGTTASGGLKVREHCFQLGRGCGVVWRLTPKPGGGWAFSIIHAFSGPDGANPLAGLVRDAAGNLYGTTELGGAYNWGTVFKLAPNPDGTWNGSVLYSFSFPDGYPSALIFDPAGNLYGTGCGGAYGDCNGEVFKLAPSPDGSWSKSVLYSFTGGADGRQPGARLIFDALGNLYGTTQLGGSSTSTQCFGMGCGVVFKLAPNSDGTWTQSVLQSFTGADGYFPADLVFDSAGNLYGTTQGGGAPGCSYGCGVVFKLAPNADGTWAESTLHAFTGGADGANPFAGLVLHAGSLYGTTLYGGTCAISTTGCGVVFKLTPTSSGWRETVLQAFLGFGHSPEAPVIFDPVGNLYGTTGQGNGNSGLVFEITHVGAVDGKPE